MHDTELTIAAVFIELGIPLGLIGLCAFKPSTRRYAVVILGSITPLLILYTAIAISHAIDSNDDNTWAFAAMWTMSFIAYVGILSVGALLSTIRWPANLYTRFFVGLLAPLFIVGLYKIIRLQY